jgi:hypothetical protein
MKELINLSFWPLPEYKKVDIVRDSAMARIIGDGGDPHYHRRGDTGLDEHGHVSLYLDRSPHRSRFFLCAKRH